MTSYDSWIMLGFYSGRSFFRSWMFHLRVFICEWREGGRCTVWWKYFFVIRGHVRIRVLFWGWVWGLGPYRLRSWVVWCWSVFDFWSHKFCSVKGSWGLKLNFIVNFFIQMKLLWNYSLLSGIITLTYININSHNEYMKKSKSKE